LTFSTILIRFMNIAREQRTTVSIVERGGAGKVDPP